MSGSSPRTTMIGATLALSFALLCTSACLSYIKSTGSGQREARRECLAYARLVGWTVMNIGDATFRGAATYEVPLTVEKEGVTAHPLLCSYNVRERSSDLREPKP